MFKNKKRIDYHQQINSEEWREDRKEWLDLCPICPVSLAPLVGRYEKARKKRTARANIHHTCYPGDAFWFQLIPLHPSIHMGVIHGVLSNFRRVKEQPSFPNLGQRIVHNYARLMMIPIMAINIPLKLIGLKPRERAIMIRGALILGACGLIAYSLWSVNGGSVSSKDHLKLAETSSLIDMSPSPSPTQQVAPQEPIQAAAPATPEVSVQQVQPSPTVTPEPQVQQPVTNSTNAHIWCNAGEGANFYSANGEKIAWLKCGEPIHATSKAQESGNALWQWIEYQGRQGWVMAENVRPGASQQQGNAFSGISSLRPAGWF